MAEYDSPWKETLERYFPAFMEFFFPQIYADIDWERGYTFLDKELEKIVRDAELGKRFVDKLVQVWRGNGEEGYLLAHIEVQGYHDPDFAKRMYVYNYRIFDRHERKVASLAVLADNGKDWRPTEYSYELWGSRAGLRFPVVKLLDYQERWQGLETSRNPFAAVVMAHLKAMETAKDQQSRFQWKLKLVRQLYGQGHEQQDILELFRFIDWVMILPEKLEEQFWQELNRFEERQQMQYITSVERIGIKKGMQLGRQEGRMEEGRAMLKMQLTKRFKTLPRWVEERLEQATQIELEHWAENILDATTLEEVFQ